MEFSNRNVQSSAAAPGGQTSAPVGSGGKKNKLSQGKWARVGTAVAVLVIAVLLCAAIVVAAVGGAKPENKYVETGNLQAVFLNTGQVYFGSIKSLNSKYVVLTNIYYLQTSSTGTAGASNASSNVTLVKLGCELHEPFDQMVINRDQVTFWENLQDGGQVAKAVKTFQQQNPNGQKCADQSTSASSNSANSTQSAGTSSTPAKP